MNAYVQIDEDGYFTNENHFLAWRGFNYFDYDVKLFKSHEIHKLDITKETPLFAGVATTIGAFKKLKIDYLNKELSSYPESLDKYLGRKIEILKFSEIWWRLNNGHKIFIKPLDKDRKAFDGTLLDGQKGLDFIKEMPGFIKTYAFEPVNILSEYRVFINKGKILDSRRYRGDFRLNIDYFIVENAIKDLENPPISYCLDFGLTDDNKTILVEATDAWAFAPYGLDMIHFTNVIIDRWKEIIS